MTEETLLTAARRVARFFRLDQSHGGLVSIETIQAVETLDIQIAREADRQKHEPQPKPETDRPPAC